jgi:hypothetical protein
MDGTADKGGFTEAQEMYRAQGHYLMQVVLRVGASVLVKDVEVYLRTAFGDVPVIATTVAAVDEYYFLSDFTMYAGPGEYFVVTTDHCVTEVFASIYTVGTVAEW